MLQEIVQLSLNSGVGVTVKHFDGENVYNIILGLMAADRDVTDDGLSFGYKSHAIDHVITFFRSVFPSSVKFSSIFPKEIYDDQGQISGSLKLPFVAIRAARGPSKEVGIGGMLWEDSQAVYYAFNQTMYFEFDILDRKMMKVDQVADHISLQLQKQKRFGGELWRKGFQNFEIMQSEPARGFRYDTAWDFRMQHQYVDLFHTRLVVRTMFDVVWADKTGHDGVISMIVFQQTVDIPWSTSIGSTLAHLILEDQFFDWHHNTLL